MNLKRIIREEINDFSDSFYLIVSADENFIYRRNNLGGYKWQPIDNINPKEIVNSGFKEYSEAYDMMERRISQGFGKIVSIDFILNKRNDNFPMMESNDMEWIKDIKSNKDIAEELFNQTMITKNRGIVKLPYAIPSFLIPGMVLLSQQQKPYFKLSMKKKYGIDEDSDDIWERYKVLVNNRLKELRPENLKESNDISWIDESMPTLRDAFYGGLLKVGDIVTLSGQLVDSKRRSFKKVDNYRIEIKSVEDSMDSSVFTPLQEEHWRHLGYTDEPISLVKEDGDMLLISIE